MESVFADGHEGVDEDPAFLSAIAEAEADGRKRLSQQAQPCESVCSSFSGGRQGLGSHGFGQEKTPKRTKMEPEGEYLAALRGTHSETWQAMTSSSRMKPNPNLRNVALSASYDGSGASSGACFHCGKEGHWARDCPTKAFSTTSFVADGNDMQGQVPEKSCPCGGGTCKVLTANTEKNAGRQFYKCPLRKEEGQCGYFEWCDASTGMSQGLPRERGSNLIPSDLPCPCSAGPCITLTAKTEKNMGRQFYRCPLNQGEGGCGFFKWCDEASAPSAPTSGSQFRDRVTSTSSASSGHCFKCGMDGHWAKDCANSSFAAQTTHPKAFGSTRAGQGGSGASGNCFKCGQAGHWSHNCPNQQSGHGNSRYGVENKVSGGLNNAASGGCFKCGSQGHWSKDCPQPFNPRPTSYGAQSHGVYGATPSPGKGGNQVSCYRCGRQGHFANECMTDGKG